MGQKIHPRATRLGFVQDWESRWLSLKDMPALIGEDFKIRRLVKERFRLAAVSWVGIERTGSYLRVNIHTARPGVVIGKKGVDIESVRAAIENITASKTFLNVIEIKDPELDARLVAEAVALQIEKRVAYRRAIRRAMERTMQSGALGVKVMAAGRLGGSEIARREWQREGRVPLHTFSADIDYGFSEAYTTMGLIGVKVWIFRKQLYVKSPRELLLAARKEKQSQEASAALVEVPKPASAPAVSSPLGQGEGRTAAPAEGSMPDLPDHAMSQLRGEEFNFEKEPDTDAEETKEP
ncbi:MAG: 30S ribosomal protein S3 [Elusimicrobia bacterium]|nr:30S ribosomal protein S3 [Elusimicrobiota bacterium]